MTEPRRWMVAAVLTTLLLAACGGGGDGAVASGEGDDGDVVSTTTTEAADTTSTTDSIEMPDLDGLTETEARAELRSAGIDDVAVEEAESLEEAGLVLRQVPSAGARVRGAVTIVIASPLPPMPDYVGSNLAEARQWYEDRDITVTEEKKLDDSVPPGTVLATTPKAGEPVIGEVLITVSERPFTQALSEFEWPEQCSHSEVKDAEVNGDVYPRSVVMTPYISFSKSYPCAIDINLSRDWQTFKTTIGLTDTTSADALIRFEVLADGSSIFRQSVGLGSAVPVSLDVTNVLRLQLIATIESGKNGEAVWGEPVIQGLPPEG